MSFRRGGNPMRIAISLFLVAITLLAYWPVLDNGFVNFDDGRYVTENTNIKKGLTREAVTWAFTQSYAARNKKMTRSLF